jgi:pimeloyl-ACP methyl ester carboxylesterase
VADLNKLLKALGITQKVHLLGLSYGGGMAIEFAGTYPNKVATIMAESAFTAPLKGQVDQINAAIAMTRLTFPFNPSSDAQLYSFFLRSIVYTTYPLSEPIVLEHPYKLESVYRLAEGTKNFRGTDWIANFPKGSYHQIDAAKDQYITPDVPQGFWDAMPLATRASRMILDHSEHKIPEAMPHISAEWVKLIIKRDPRLQNGETWRGGVWVGGFVAGTEKIVIN